MNRITKAEVDAFLEAHPDINAIDMMIPDAAGVLRGKRLAREGVSKLYKDGVRIPSSTYLMETCGQNSPNIPYGTEDCDPDLACFGAAGTLKPVPWAEGQIGQVIASMEEDDGTPFFGDPRHILERALQPFKDMGLTPVVAIELEFYLLDRKLNKQGMARAAKSDTMGRRQTQAQVYGIEELYEFESLLEEINQACLIQGLPTDTVISEYAPCQYEINLNHVGDALQACDDALMLKRLVKGVARKHGYTATFMAKPFADQSGNGMHIHSSVVDEDGNNFFSDKIDEETGYPMGDNLRYAIGGLKATMAEGMAFFAPNANSYRRFQPGAYAPINTAWGTNNRTVSLRVPHCDKKSVRVEHRPAGADANPYLTMAAVVAGMHYGIANKVHPGPMEKGDAYKNPTSDLPVRWAQALGLFNQGTVLKTYLGEHYCEIYEKIKWGEYDYCSSTITPLDFELYMHSV